MVLTASKAQGLFTEQDRYTEQGTANATLTSTLTGVRGKILMIICKYSAGPTQAGVTMTLNSGAGAAWNALLNTGTANAQTTVYQPSVPIPILADDSLVVVAPAGGVGITAAIAIYLEPGT